MEKTFQELQASGLNITAMSQDGNFKVTSYIGKRRGSRVYGRFDHKLQKYVEEKIK